VHSSRNVFRAFVSPAVESFVPNGGGAPASGQGGEPCEVERIVAASGEQSSRDPRSPSNVAVLGASARIVSRTRMTGNTYVY